ncbi:hypothetical protein [Virgibacillus alimentarius]|uniref:hypothetical protein n=1 Tax=Virgibacillus alimentarius TaxID=698769 RepID=UPI0004938A01|nr:hypothetical protein [Virgibacillus alimentarius]
MLSKVVDNEIEEFLGCGEALFQDIYGCTEVVKIFLVFQDIFDAFDSSTSTKAEKEREMRRLREGVG